MRRVFAVIVLLLLSGVTHAATRGYYRYPAIHENTLVFTAEGDLWKVPLKGGEATRLTTHLGQETRPAISRDGKTIAFKGAKEAAPLAGDYAGTSRNPMWHHDRIYFAFDRDGVMNLWSMTAAGKKLKQHTFHKAFDALSPCRSPTGFWTLNPGPSTTLPPSPGRSRSASPACLF